ncbi:uncharacterized protein LOC116502570 [Thamnophis elegans]|uniref:uncharacterized protein LOC116502570 n=1 Tax=Thamnophis elegans TaxID=35005 RepID=UPI001376CB10|nr:uncharacterized protein LOC116502570 [Thamnophis elegans]
MAQAGLTEGRNPGPFSFTSNLSGFLSGCHTWQVNLGCELREDGSKRGFLHYGYDGRDFISFDKETLRWVTAQPQAKKVKEKWEEDPRWSHGNKVFLEKTCIEWLQRYLSYQKEVLQRIEPPVGKVTHKVVDDSLEVLICQAFGFYPKEIQATWRRDGEVFQNETLRRNVAPNSDGTYYVLLSIEIDPKERDRFRCYLEHEGLWEPLVLAWKEETGESSNMVDFLGNCDFHDLDSLPDMDTKVTGQDRCDDNDSNKQGILVQDEELIFDRGKCETDITHQSHKKSKVSKKRSHLLIGDSMHEASCGSSGPQNALKAIVSKLSMQKQKHPTVTRCQSSAGELAVPLQAPVEAGATESGVRMISQPMVNPGSLFQCPKVSEGEVFVLSVF